VSDPETEAKFTELLDVMARLRSETGCPWDRQQTHLSLKPCLLEETYELIDALDDGGAKKLKEELGDVLLQVVFHAQIAKEDGRFTIKEVISLLIDKLVRRHPYVFAGEPLPEDAAAVLKQRVQIKANEKNDGEVKSALGNLPRAMPALARAQSISRRAAHLGFEWPDISQVWAKVEEEMRELEEATASGDKSRTGEEFGDLLFTLVNVARSLNVDPELALRGATGRFVSRVELAVQLASREREDWTALGLEEQDRYYDQAKQALG